jgi:hypothetical protein
VEGLGLLVPVLFPRENQGGYPPEGWPKSLTRVLRISQGRLFSSLYEILYEKEGLERGKIES